MTALVPLKSIVNTEETSTSATVADTACSIAGASLLNTVVYLVMYTVGNGMSATTTHPESTVEFGGTVYAKILLDGSTSGGVNYGRSKPLSGYFLVTGDGSEQLVIRKRRASGTGTAYFGGMSLIAIPLTLLTEGTDYEETSNTNTDTAQLTISSNGTTSTLLTLTKTLAAEDYLVLASAEVDTPLVNEANAGTKVDIDGTDQKIDAVTIARAADDSVYESFSYARIHTFTAASHTIKIEGVASGGASGNRTWRRGRIILIKTSVFDQMVSASDDTTDTIGVNYSTYEDDISQAYTANQTEDVVVLGNLLTSMKQNFRASYFILENNTDATEYSKNMGSDSQFSQATGVQVTSILLAGCENITTGAKTYKIRRTDESNTTHNTVDGSDIIIWSMTLAGGYSAGFAHSQGYVIG